MLSGSLVRSTIVLVFLSSRAYDREKRLYLNGFWTTLQLPAECSINSLSLHFHWFIPDPRTTNSHNFAESELLSALLRVSFQPLSLTISAIKWSSKVSKWPNGWDVKPSCRRNFFELIDHSGLLLIASVRISCFFYWILTVFSQKGWFLDIPSLSFSWTKCFFLMLRWFVL